MRAVILFLFALALGSVARADITLNFVYDPITGATTATYFGSWGSWTGAIQDTGASGGISPAGIVHYGSQSSYVNTTVFSTATIPWTVNTSTPTYSGDAWGFTTGRVIAPSSYTANAAINGSLTFPGLNLAQLGFTASSGTMGSGAFVVNWTAMAIPEPGTWSLGCGCAVLVFVSWRRRWRRSPA